MRHLRRAGVAAGCLLLSGCMTGEEMAYLAAALHVEAQCPNCNWQQRQQLTEQYIRQNYPQLEVERLRGQIEARNSELRASHTNFSDPDTYRCRLHNSSTGITSTGDFRIENGEWNYGPAYGPFTAGRCNQAFFEGGYSKEIVCTFRHNAYTRSITAIAINNIGGDWVSISTIYPNSGEYVVESYGIARNTSERLTGQCEVLPR